MAPVSTRAEFREAFELHREAVHRFAWRLTRNAHDAEDLTQETFVTFWRKRHLYRGEGSLAGYLRKIAYHRFLNAQARLSARKPPLPLTHVPVPEGDGRLEGVEERDHRRFLRERIEEALAALPEQIRTAFVLFRFEGLKVREVAEIMDAPLKTVESRLRRAHQHLLERLSRYKDKLFLR